MFKLKIGYIGKAKHEKRIEETKKRTLDYTKLRFNGSSLRQVESPCKEIDENNIETFSWRENKGEAPFYFTDGTDTYVISRVLPAFETSGRGPERGRKKRDHRGPQQTDRRVQDFGQPARLRPRVHLFDVLRRIDRARKLALEKTARLFGRLPGQRLRQ